MPATWSYDEMKRLADVDVLRGRDEGAQASAKEDGRGLYKRIEHENDENIAKSKKKIEQYKSDAEESSKAYQRDMANYQRQASLYQAGQTSTYPTEPKPPVMADPPKPDEAVKIPDDLSGYVDFLHPWGNMVVNPLVLIFMFFILIGATVLALRAQDIG